MKLFEKFLRWIYFKFEYFKQEAAELAKFRREVAQRDKEREELREFERKRNRHEYALAHGKNVLKRQATCLHLKGGRRGRRANIPKDYAVSTHTFIDGSMYIKCLLCSKIWRPGETGWADAIGMTRQSTNTPTSSERVMLTPSPYKTFFVENDRIGYKPSAIPTEKHGPDSIS